MISFNISCPTKAFDREPSEYRDSFAVLTEQGILRKEDLEKFENIASFHNLIVHYYEHVDDAVVYAVFQENLSDFDLFVSRIIEYLEREKKPF
jgi:uncharacterized protein YutE (UPF0331/DUF86 family)